MTEYKGPLCHGCGGKGWVVGGTASPCVCVICQGTGVAQKKYVGESTPVVHPRKCPNAVLYGGICNCTGACMMLPSSRVREVWTK